MVLLEYQPNDIKKLKMIFQNDKIMKYTLDDVYNGQGFGQTHR